MSRVLYTPEPKGVYTAQLSSRPSHASLICTAIFRHYCPTAFRLWSFSLSQEKALLVEKGSCAGEAVGKGSSSKEVTEPFLTVSLLPEPFTAACSYAYPTCYHKYRQALTRSETDPSSSCPPNLHISIARYRFMLLIITPLP